MTDEKKTKKRTGTVRFRNGTYYVGMRLRSKRWWERKVERPTDGGPYDESYAQLILASFVREYVTGAWDPEARKAPPKGNPHTGDYVKTWAKDLEYETAPKERSQIDRYLRPSILGGVRVRDVTPHDAAEWIAWLKMLPSKRGGKLSPSAIRNAYDVVQRAFDRAVFDRLVASNPMREARKFGNLPSKTDKHEGDREGWTFTHEEIVRILTAPAIPPDWRVRYALLFLTGMRFGESAALRWRDWDRTVTPLTRITIQRAIKSVSGKEARTKTGAKKLAPVHPSLEAVLVAWHGGGWEKAYGRAPSPDDLVVPSGRGKLKGHPPNSSAANRRFQIHQTALGLRPRSQHVARHAFISLAQDDGADGAVLRWVTHAPPRSAFDGYSRAQWQQLCTAVGLLRIKSETMSDGLDGTPRKS